MSRFAVRDVPASAIESLSASARVHPLTARCLIARGAHTPALAATYLEPRLGQLRAPVGLADLDRAVERIANAISGGELVGVFGDYDVDGVTTATLLASAIEAFGGRACPRVASRSAGYGFGEADATFFADQMCHLIITGDCGTSDLKAIAEANRRGLEVIVIDHHTVPDSAAEHPSYALINPFRADSSFEFTGFASVGLSFYVMQKVRSVLRGRGHFRERREPDLRAWLDLVAVGTIADLVPLTEENRILTSWGLKVLNQRKRPGFVELLRNAGADDDAPITARDVGWKIGPRLNAPGRLGDAEPALRLLMATDSASAAELAADLEQSNDDRRSAQDSAYAEALELIEKSPPGPCAVVAGRGWKPGVVGIVAARLVDLLARPVFAIAIDENGVARGSARTFGGVNVYNALATCSHLTSRFGGHAAAAGLTMEAGDIDALRAGLEAAVAEQQIGGSPTLELADAVISIADLLNSNGANGSDGSPSKVALELEAMRPFGKGNPALRFVARGLEVKEARAVGAERDHLKLVLFQPGVEIGSGAEIGAIGFGLGAEKPEVGSRIDVLCSPLINRWRGRVRMELQVHALVSTEGEQPALQVPAAHAPAAAQPSVAGAGASIGASIDTSIDTSVDTSVPVALQ